MSQCPKDCSSERAITTEGRLARVEAKLDAVNEKLDDAILSQLRDHGKRIGSLESWRARQAGWMAGAATVGGIVGAVGSKIVGMVW